MRITSLKIERFGVWEDLNLPKISRGLNVFFGPNEAGKTTLMQFIRTCLYGGGDEERARYIQMALDGRRRRSKDEILASSALDPRRMNPNAAELDERSSVPDELRRFLESGKKVEVASDSHAAARDASRAWIGGTATVSSDFGDHRLERRYIRRDVTYQSAVERKAGFVVSDGLLNWSGRFYSLPGLKIAESLVVTGPDGTRVGDYFAKSLTCNLDESTYNGVFAIGLDELQKLGMLNETEAAQMLYRLSVGVDRGAFVQVFQQIVAERNDLLDSKGRPSILDNLIAERDRSRQKATESATNLREYARLLEERRAVVEATKILQDRIDKSTYQKRLRELAVRVAPVWDDRDAARAALTAMGEVPVVERTSLDECAALVGLANETRAKIRALKNEYLSKRDARDAIKIDQALDELAPRVTILEEDLPRLDEIDRKVAELRVELDELNAKLSEEDARVRSARDGKIMLTQSALDAINASIVADKLAPEAQLAAQASKDAPVVSLPNKLAETGVSYKEVEDFKIPARAVRRRRLRLQKYREELARVNERLAGLVEKLEQGLTSHSQKNLTEAIEKTGALVTGLRRRIEVERRVAEMSAYRKELERQNKSLAENQAIVGPTYYTLVGGVALGALLFGISLFTLGHRVHPAIGLIGLLTVVFCLLYKATVERKNREKLEDNQRRLGLLTKQLEQANAETASLDERFPAPVNQPSASFENRLQKARADLAFFESLAPVEAQWRDVTRQSRAEEARVKKGEEALKKSRKRWRGWLRSACLPTTLTPTQVRDLLARVGIADDLRRQIDAVCTEIEYLGRERQGIVDRLNAATALVAKYEIDEPIPAKLVPKLRGLLDDYAGVLQERAVLFDQMGALKKDCRKALALRRRQLRDVRRFLVGYGVKTRDELVAAVDRYETFQLRRAELEAAQQRLNDGIAEFCPEDEIGALLLDPDVRKDLPTTIENLDVRLAAFDAELKGKLELSGRLGQQADAIAAKKDSIKQRFDAIAADLRLAKMAELWRSRSVAGQMMEDIRRAYEKERQPETLREASRYLKRLTNGMYVNIWTPLGEDALFVDAANGETLDVAALSRGTRELLFIAIRLALVVSFEKHGVQMPLIWDDVLVNFDYKRAATAAKLLCDFAKAGRQIFLFTCHEHICRLFLRMGVPVCVLPTASDPAKRKFRVLTPPKRRRSKDVTIDVARPVELGPNFNEEPNAAPRTATFVVDGSEVETQEIVATRAPIVEEPVEYLMTNDAERVAEVQLETYGFDRSRRPYMQVTPVEEEPADVMKVESALAAETFDELRVRPAREAFDVSSTPTTFVEVETRVTSNDPELLTPREFTVEEPRRVVPTDVSSFVYATTKPDEFVATRVGAPTEYAPAPRDVSFDGENVKFRALSEISPTFSADRVVAEPRFEVSGERVVVSPIDDAALDAELHDELSEDEEANYELANDDLSDVRSVDYDKWTDVFGETKERASDEEDEDESDESERPFVDYLVSGDGKDATVDVEVPSDEYDEEEYEEYEESDEEYDDDSDDESDEDDESDDEEEYEDEEEEEDGDDGDD